MPGTRNVILSVVTRVAVVILLLALGIGAYIALFVTRDQPEPAVPDDEPPRVLVIRTDPVAVRRQFEGFGTAAAQRSANVPAQVRGQIEEIPDAVVEGRAVQRGQVLARLDDSDFLREVEVRAAQLEETQAQVRQLQIEHQAAMRRIELVQQEVQLAQADLDRVLEARDIAGATQREVDQQRQALVARMREEVAAWEQLEQIQPRQEQLEATRAQQQSALQLAEQNLQRTVITSPIDGIIQRVDGEVGESVQVDQAIARVVDLRRMEVPLRLPAGARPHVTVGSAVLVRSSANQTHWQAIVARIAPEDDEAARTMTVYLELEQDPSENAAELLSPGQFVRGRVESAIEQRRTIVPRRSLVGDRINLVIDGALHSRRVHVDFQLQAEFPELGLDDDHWLVLREPLPEDSLLVVERGRRLSEGMRVQPVLADAEGSLP